MRSDDEQIYQIEVKLNLVRHAFHPASGWRVNVHLDPMELAHGGKHRDGKAERASAAARALDELGAKLGIDDRFGRADVVASHATEGLHLIEVEGDSSRQAEQAIYSCLGQVLLTMQAWGGHLHYGIAVPDSAKWRHQLAKIPQAVRRRLDMDLYFVDTKGLVKIPPDEDVPRPLRR
jgi:hypothetical protein